MIALREPLIKCTYTNLREEIEARLADRTPSITTDGAQYLSQIITQAVHTAVELGLEKSATWVATTSTTILDLFFDMVARIRHPERSKPSSRSTVSMGGETAADVEGQALDSLSGIESSNNSSNVALGFK